MRDCKYMFSKNLQRRQYRRAIIVLVALIAGMGVSGAIERQKPAPVTEPLPVVKTAEQIKIETILPEPVAAAIVKNAPKYPRTMAAIAHTETRGNHKAVGDSGASRGMFQIQNKYWSAEFGPVPDDLEAQVRQADQLFHALAKQYGYREAVRRWNGDGPASRKYQRTVLAKVEALQ